MPAYDQTPSSVYILYRRYFIITYRTCLKAFCSKGFSLFSVVTISVFGS